MKKFFIYAAIIAGVIGIIGLAKILNFNREIEQNKRTYLETIKKKTTSVSEMLAKYMNGKDRASEKLLKELDELLAVHQMAKYGYSFLIDSEGRFISADRESAMNASNTIFLYAQSEGIASLADLGTRAKKRLPGIFDLQARKSGEELWGMTCPIEGTNLSLIVVALKDPAAISTDNQLRSYFYGFVFIIVSISMLFAALGGIFGKTLTKKIWLSTSFFSITLTIGIAILCLFSFNTLADLDDGEIPITEQSVLDNMLDQMDIVSKQKGLDISTKIKTGIFINTIDMESAVNVRITGTIWQKQSAHISDEDIGVFFPDAIEAEQELLYERTQKGIKTTGWSFNILIRESFSGAQYPFDNEAFWIRILPKRFDKNVILVPSIEDYVTINHDYLPGLLNKLVLPGWKIKKSFFSYINEGYNTNFGIGDFIGQYGYPELYFNINVQRKFLDPFISVILPLAVVAILVFIMLLTCSLEQDRFEILGFSAGAVLSGIAALFFVVIVAQIDVRRTLAAEVITYTDVYYFVIYTIFLLVSIDSIMLCWPEKFKYLSFHNNIIVKSAYWPFITISLFIATVLYFHP